MQINRTPLSNGAEQKLIKVAQDFETHFLADFLKHMAPDQSDGAGPSLLNSEFSDLLYQEQARAIVARGGIGLSTTILQALAAVADGN